MSQADVLERMAMASGLDASESRHAREWLATSREDLGDAVTTPPFLHPPRWVPVGSPGDEPPAGRIGYLFGGIEEHWVPDYKFDRMGRSSLKGYWVSQRWMSSHCDCDSPGGIVMLDGQLAHPKCGRALASKHKDFESLREAVLSMHVQVNDEAIYNGFYPSIPGNDVVHYDPAAMAHVDIKSSDKDKMAIWRGSKEMRSKSDDPRNKRVGVRVGNQIRPMYKGESQVLRGGKEITGGRAQWRRLTKDMVLHDPGVQKDWDKVRARNEEKKQANLMDAAERYEKALPRGAEL